MGKYRTINTDLNRQYRNDLNQNFTDIERDINSANLEIKRVETETIATIDGLVGGGFVEGLETARDNANTAATNANSKATYANTQGNHAKTQGDYAKAQGDYAKSKGEYADEKAILAGQAAANANLESSNLGGLKVAVVDATQAANLATGKANTAATKADTATTAANTATGKANTATTNANAAKTNADTAALNANTKAELAQSRVDELNTLDTAINGAIADAETATAATNDAITNTETATSNAAQSATNADEKALLADTAAGNADEKALYARQQGDYAKQQGDAVQGIFDQGLVASVNGKTGAVVLTAADVNSVEKAVGKQLSTEDYTTAEKAKLTGVSPGANNYVHPASHPASIITESTTKRFSSDTEKAEWNAKETTTGSQAKVNAHASEDASTTKKGHVILSDSTSNTSIIQGATSNAVKKAFDRATFVNSAQVNRLGLNAFTEATPMSDYPLGYSVFYVQSSSNPWSILSAGFGVVEVLKTVDLSWGIQRITEHGNSASRGVHYRAVGSNESGIPWGEWEKLITSNDIKSGTGSPEGIVTARIGTLYLRTDGGANTTFYVKETGTGNTGWKAK